MKKEVPAWKLWLYGVTTTDDELYDTHMIMGMIGQGSSEEPAQPLNASE